LFAGAKEVRVINAYETQLNLNRFDLLIDWGWFYFITKPLFKVIDWLYHLVGNFGLAILAVTVLIKLAFYPLANKSYASMAKMKAVQPQMVALKARFPVFACFCRQQDVDGRDKPGHDGSREAASHRLWGWGPAYCARRASRFRAGTNGDRPPPVTPPPR
jgi:hypothetical protein